MNSRVRAIALFWLILSVLTVAASWKRDDER